MDGYSKALKGHTPVEFFKLKLRGEPVDVLRKTLAKELADWLIEREIFARSIAGGYACKYSYVCKYPVRIWHQNNKHEQIKVDSLKPGDIWTF